ncbi:S8 family serine peptidase [Mesonia sp. HuA40]|uniref:S8 family serine peptidase n=1 Tax=Mesonia sp. HuA40 TaxID=2602761 RepID=UPI0011CB1CE1|nr:S8 family serine peptidase [Mesonia sp. HuA40]TXK75334.1 S8 family serine peptidase [Mesonia sp. HuA40]
MKLNRLLSLGFVLTSGLALSQTASEVKQIQKQNQPIKIELAQELANNLEAKRNEARKKAESFGISIDRIENNKRYNLVGFENGKPIYRTTHNLDAAKSTRANFLWQGGSLGLNLEGQNMTIGIWDGGRVRKDHQEFATASGSRVVLGDATPFNQDEFDSHGTHVGGTMAAAGTNPNAKGMAPQATLVSYNWTSDLSEVDTEAQNGLLISNHSYGIPVNDGGSQNAPTWMMGCYDTQARLWDLKANAYPYYLMVVSAGNDGQSSYQGGLRAGYDKLTGEKNAKNNLVVGNAQDASVDPSSGELLFPVFINSGSSQGPSDDGRIKPDVVGNGTQVFSPVDASTASYATFSGTSMAAPNVAGTLTLVQQYYNQEKTNFMLSSSLRALAIHTADDLGNTGPDARYGWGLVNAKKAIEVIQDSQTDNARIEEVDLDNGDTFTFTVTKDPSQDLRVTIAWNDPAGNAKDGQLNSPTPALVNDLDLRVTNQATNTTLLPYRLNLSNVAAPATLGDNTVDNVESILVESTDANTYEIKVSHKGSLSGSSQMVSIVVSGVQSTSLSAEQVTLSEDISVWPNPVRGASDINIALGDNINANAQVKLYDLQGRLVANKNYDNTNGNLKLSTASLQRGVYILQVGVNGENYQHKILIE